MAIAMEVVDTDTDIVMEDMDTAMEVVDTDTVMVDMVIVMEDMVIVMDNRGSQQRRKEKSSERNFTPTGMTTRKMRRATSLPSGSMR